MILGDNRSNFNPKIKKHTYRFKISSPKLYYDLIDLGCFEHKTNILLFPTEEQVPHQFLNSFIAGLLDGDGALSIHTEKNGYVRFYMSFTGTKEIINGIQKFFQSNVVVRARWPERNSNNVSITYDGVHTVFDKISLLYQDTTIRLPRKYETYLRMCEDSRVK